MMLTRIMLQFTLDAYAHVLPHMQDEAVAKNRGSALWERGGSSAQEPE
jgi:hypothetical protein